MTLPPDPTPDNVATGKLVFDHVPLQTKMNAAIDTVLDILDEASTKNVEIDPLATILDRVRARGADIDLSSAPPLLQMILGPMLAE